MHNATHTTVPREPGSAVEVDIQGPLSMATVGDARYTVDFVIRNPPAIYTALIVAKSDATREVAPFAAHLRGIGFPVQIVRTDLAPDLTERPFAEVSGRSGIACEFVVPERKFAGEVAHLRVADVVRANMALVRGVLGIRFWGYAYLLAVQ